MPRQMFDSINPAAIPTTAAVVAGYLNGKYAWTAAGWARFPNAVKAGIVISAVNAGAILDVETFDATPAQVPGWVTMRRKAGQVPTVYCNASTWPDVKKAVAAAGILPPLYWVAGYGTPPDPSIPAGAIGHQYTDTGSVDLSTVADFWPGVDLAAPPGSGDDPMNTTDIVAVFVAGPGVAGAATGGPERIELHRDGGLYAYGGADPAQLVYTAFTNIPGEYWSFPYQGQTNFNGLVSLGLIASLTPGGPPGSGWPTRFFADWHIASYRGAVVGIGPVGPAGVQGVAGLAGAPGAAGKPGASGALTAAEVAAIDALDKAVHGS